MEFIKKHYEKILLGVVLLGLLAALLLLPFLIGADREKQHNITIGIINRPPKPLPALNLALESDAFNRVQAPYHLDFEATNKLFNPVKWERTPDGRLIKIATPNAIGPSAVVVTKIIPLYFTLKLTTVDTNYGDRYDISVQRQAARYPSQRQRQERFVSMDDRKRDLFTLESVKGNPADPSELVLQLADTGETVHLSPKKPYRRVDGYAADLKYPPEGKQWSDQRVGSVLRFAGGIYIIVAIDRNEVIVSAESNQKKTVLPYKPH